MSEKVCASGWYHLFYSTLNNVGSVVQIYSHTLSSNIVLVVASVHIVYLLPTDKLSPCSTIKLSTDWDTTASIHIIRTSLLRNTFSWFVWSSSVPSRRLYSVFKNRKLCPVFQIEINISLTQFFALDQKYLIFYPHT